MMPELEEGTFVRVLAPGRNHGKLGIVVEPGASDAKPGRWHVWVEMAHPDLLGGVYRVLYHVNDLRVADELDSYG